MTPGGIEPATFRFVAQHLNHWATAVPKYIHISLLHGILFYFLLKILWLVKTSVHCLILIKKFQWRQTLGFYLKLNFHDLCTDDSLCEIDQTVHIKSNPITGLDRPWGFQEVEVPRFQDNRHMKVVRSSALRTDRLYPPVNIPGPHSC